MRLPVIMAERLKQAVTKAADDQAYENMAKIDNLVVHIKKKTEELGKILNGTELKDEAYRYINVNRHNHNALKDMKSFHLMSGGELRAIGAQTLRTHLMGEYSARLKNFDKRDIPSRKSVNRGGIFLEVPASPEDFRPLAYSDVDRFISEGLFFLSLSEGALFDACPSKTIHDIDNILSQYPAVLEVLREFVDVCRQHDINLTVGFTFSRPPKTNTWSPYTPDINYLVVTSIHFLVLPFKSFSKENIPHTLLETSQTTPEATPEVN